MEKLHRSYFRKRSYFFEGDRLEPSSDIRPVGALFGLTAGSTNNEFSYTTIKNGLWVFEVDSNDGG
jgi:hypothetical protein